MKVRLRAGWLVLPLLLTAVASCGGGDSDDGSPADDVVTPGEDTSGTTPDQDVIPSGSDVPVQPDIQDPGCGPLNTPEHCGSCDIQCSGDTPYCVQNGSTWECGFGCSGATPDLCGTTCVNQQTDPAHCGSCEACTPPNNSTATCAFGVCGFTCNEGHHLCGQTCRSNQSPASCGNACTACPAPEHATATCDGTSCGWVCDTDYAMLGDGCVPATEVWVPQTSGVPSSKSLMSVWSSYSDPSVYAVGADGTILHSEGNGIWTVQTSGTTETLFGVWGSDSSDIYAVGSNGVVLHSTGNGVWTAQTGIPDTVWLWAVWGLDSGDVYVVGGDDTFGRIYHSNGDGTWIEQEAAQNPWHEFVSISGEAINGMYAIDSNPSGGWIFYSDGDGQWSVEQEGLEILEAYNGISVAKGGTDWWIVGDNGTIVHGRGQSTYTQEPTTSTADLKAVSAIGPSNRYAVGSDGTILHREGYDPEWVAQDSGTTETLTAIWYGFGGYYVVGYNGTILFKESL